jgi:hypothetical protein
MNKAIILLFGILVIAAVSGCTMPTDSSQQDSISSEAEAMDTMINVSNDIENVGSAFDDIDALLG